MFIINKSEVATFDFTGILEGDEITIESNDFIAYGSLLERAEMEHDLAETQAIFDAE